jgi:hypothetical protein
MLRREPLAAFAVCLAVSACTPPKPPTQSIDYYIAHPDERKAILANCTNWWGGWGTDEQPCQNAYGADYAIKNPGAPRLQFCKSKDNPQGAYCGAGL